METVGFISLDYFHPGQGILDQGRAVRILGVWKILSVHNVVASPSPTTRSLPEFYTEKLGRISW